MQKRGFPLAPAIVDATIYLGDLKEHPDEWRSWILNQKEAYCLLRGLRRLRLTYGEDIEFLSRRENIAELMVMGRYHSPPLI